MYNHLNHSTPLFSGQRWLANLRISHKLMLMAAVPLLMFLAFSAWQAKALRHLEAQSLAEVDLRAERALLMKDVNEHVVQVQQYLSDVSATRAQDGLSDGFKRAQEEKAGFETGLKRLVELGLADAQAQALGKAFAAYYTQGEAMAQAYVRGGPAEGNPMMPAFDKASTALDQVLEPLVEQESQALHASLAQARATSEDVRATAAWLVAAMVLGLTASAWVIAQSILRPVRQASAVVRQVAQGDLRRQALHASGDEIGRMLSDIGHMQDSLHELLYKVRDSAMELYTASEEISQANHDLNQRTERNAAALEQTGVSIQGIRQMTDDSAQHAVSTSDFAQQASTVAEQARGIVGELGHTMRNVEQASRRIAEITGSIDAIAFQTNILALNAAVEAARAGEAGRGFAVVAGEVRALAQRAAEAASEIRRLSADTGQAVAHGTELAQQADLVVGKTVNVIAQASSQIHEVTQMAQSQHDSLQQLTLAVGTLEESTQQNAALVEQNSAASEELTRHAAELSSAVQYFKVDAQGAMLAAA